MLTVVRLCIFLASFSALVSAQTNSSLTEATVYNNCSGNLAQSPPGNVESTPYYKPQIRINPLDIDKNGTGWEEWLFIGHNPLPGGDEFMYGFRFNLGDQGSGNVSYQTFEAWGHFPDGTAYDNSVHDVFTYEEHSDGGFTYSIGVNQLSWDPVQAVWNVSIDLDGYVIQQTTVNFAPSIPFAPDYQNKRGQIAEGLFSSVDIPRAHSNGQMVLPWGTNYTLQGVGSLKHSWSNKVIADSVSAYVRGTLFLPELPPIPVAAINWFQAWDNAGKEIDSVQFLAQQDYTSVEDQMFRLQVTNDPAIFSVVTTPKPVGLPLSFNSSEITLPMCAPGASEKDGKMVWQATKFITTGDRVDLAGGHILYNRVNVTGQVWSNGTVVQVAGIGMVEVYHRA